MTARNYTAASGVLTPAELHFRQILRAAAGLRADVLMKVRQADILKADRRDPAARNGVSQNHVDFRLRQPETLKPLIAAELDDRSHERADRKDRDEFVNEAFRTAGIPLVHVQAKNRYTRPLA